MYNSLQQREIFHLEFLRWFSRKLAPDYYALKGGVNMRFFFSSTRYSEDMDLDVSGIRVDILQDAVLKILKTRSFRENLRPYGIEDIVSQDMEKAKQTATTQRFKVHLMTFSGVDLYTKIEFSRRGLKEGITVSAIPDKVLRPYKAAPIIVPHYDAAAAVMQKIDALASRPAVQARDIFDLFILGPGIDVSEIERSLRPEDEIIEKAYENLFLVDYEQFRDEVISFLSAEEQANYDSSLFWDEVKLRVSELLERIKKEDG